MVFSAGVIENFNKILGGPHILNIEVLNTCKYAIGEIRKTYCNTVGKAQVWRLIRLQYRKWPVDGTQSDT